MDKAIMHIRDGKLISDDANYQGFIYDIALNLCVPTNERAKAKWKAVAHVFPNVVRGRTFMDVGASTGFFCFKALECGAIEAIGIEREGKKCSDVMLTVLKKCPVRGIKWIHGAWPEVKQVADVTMFLSILHHLCVQHDILLEVVLKNINRYTGYAAIVEWIGREDMWMVDKKVPKWYRRAHFEEIAKTWFVPEIIGEGHHLTRLIYLLRKEGADANDILNV